ncbi:MAG: glycosyltransferase family 9 protein [Bacteroidetes bacterium]|nr:glycosyltransferase family 9 protein [Bacteroidota bacterium]
MPKFLIIRFSSIGDIVLTTPVIRCLKQQVPDAEVHYLTKRSFASVLMGNPYIDKLYFLEDNFVEILSELKRENYDAVIDLHHNQRSLRIKVALGERVFHFTN